MAPGGHSREIEQLKTMLFQTETARLEALETDVASLQHYVGGADRLEMATADILIAALERAEVDKPRELANVIAPCVVSAIRTEIRNSREMMVDALYPITGRLVSAAVANAFKELVAFLEERLNALTSTELWVGRIKSLATGRPISEFVLANSNPPSVKRLLLIERGNGRLVADWTREGVPDERADLLSAMVAAILEFSVEALAGEGNLQKLDFGGREIVLRASPRFILAAEYTGSLRAADDARINSLFFDTIESIDRGSECDAAMLASLAASIGTSPPPRKTTHWAGKAVLFALIAFVIALLAWWGGTSVSRMMVEHRADRALQQFADTHPLVKSFPLRLAFDHANRSVSVLGIEPDQVDTGPLVGALATAAAPYHVIDRIGVVPGMDQSASLQSGMADIRQSLARLQETIGALRAETAKQAESASQRYAAVEERYAGLGRKVDALRQGMAKEAESSSQRYAAVEERYAGLDQKIDALRSVVDSPAEKLRRFISSNAIFFGDGDAFADEAKAEQQLRQLAGLLANNDLKVRIVGYTDESGTEATNKTVARKRAQRVAQQLVALGIAPSRLPIVSRAATMPISDGAGAGDDNNRRVTFESVFRTEPSQ